MSQQGTSRADEYRHHVMSRLFVEEGMDMTPDGALIDYETADEMSQRLFGEPAVKFDSEVQHQMTLTGEQMAELMILAEVTGTPINDLLRQAVDNLLFDARYDGAFDGKD